MATVTEIERLAAAVNQLRPDWPRASLLTYFTEHAARAYADLAVAAIAVAVDPKSRTPRRMDEAGPWWQLTNQNVTNLVGPGDEPACDSPGHEHELARACRWCRSEALATPPADRKAAS